MAKRAGMTMHTLSSDPLSFLVAHRGYASRFPENTLPALDAAVQAGARYIEVDVLLSADAVPVVFHDRDCRRLCGADGAIHDYPLAALRGLTAYAPDRFGDRYRGTCIPTVEELGQWLDRHGGVTVFVEIKRQAIERFGAAAVVDATYRALGPARARTVLISFSPEALAAARPLWRNIGLIADRLGDLQAAATGGLSCEIIFCDIDGLPPAGPLAAPVPLAVYEVPDADTARGLVARGVTFIETFAIGELAAALQR